MEWRERKNEIHREEEEVTGKKGRRKGEQKQEGRRETETENPRYMERWIKKEKSVFSANSTT